MSRRKYKTSFLLTLSNIFLIVQSEVEVKKERSHELEQRCKEFGKNPFFETELVTGKPWRIYYTWNMNLANKCLDMNFQFASPMVIRRVYNDMKDYLEEQPVWGAASLLFTMGQARHEMLLFNDQGPAGRFIAVPNVVRDSNISPHRNAVPLLKFQLKLINDGQFLVMMDCHIGVVSLAARFDVPPSTVEIAKTVASLGLGDGDHACLQDRPKDDKVTP